MGTKGSLPYMLSNSTTRHYYGCSSIDVVRQVRNHLYGLLNVGMGYVVNVHSCRNGEKKEEGRKRKRADRSLRRKRKNVGDSKCFVMLLGSGRSQSNLVAFSFSHGSIILDPQVFSPISTILYCTVHGLQLVTTSQSPHPHIFLLSNWTPQSILQCVVCLVFLKYIFLC